MFPVLADVGPLRLSTRDIFTVTGLMAASPSTTWRLGANGCCIRASR